MGAPPLASNLTLLAAILAAHAALAATPDSGEFRRALHSADAAAIARLGASLDHGVIARVIAGDDRVAAIAAIRAAPANPDSWALLDPLATTANGPDRPLAIASARAALTIAEALDHELVSHHDIPDDLVDEARLRWREVGASQQRWSDVRVLALVVSNRLAALTGDLPGYVIDERLVDDEPEVRRAALELLPELASSAEIMRVAARLRDDPDEVVAAVAGQILCEAATNADAPALAAIDAAGRARLRDLVVTTDLPATALLGCARCLAAAGDGASMAALRQLANKGPRSIRRRVRRLFGNKK